MITVEVQGDTKVLAYLSGMTARMHAALLRATARLGFELREIVVDKNLAGAVLKRQTGKLAGAQNLRVTDRGSVITAAVGFNKNTVPYGAFHEFGVPHSWLIEAKRAKALRFKVGGKVIFRKRVIHPPLPERSFLRSALAELSPRVLPTLEAAVKEAIA